MTLIPKRLSSDPAFPLPRKPWLWLLLLATTFFLLWLSPLGSPDVPASVPSLTVLSYLLAPLILWIWLSQGTGWGLATAIWSCLLAGFIALASRQEILFWLPVELIALSLVTHYGITRWQRQVKIRAVEVEHLEANSNTSIQTLGRMLRLETGLRFRLERYQKLRQTANTFGATLPLEQLVEQITLGVLELIQDADNALLYLVDSKTLSLELKQATGRGGGKPIVKTKTGDLFDHWVMRQAQPLLVEDVKKDFRFSEMFAGKTQRPLGSLIGVPLMTENRCLGVLRAEANDSEKLSSDDLRLLRIIGDLAALSIENSRLYSRMSELALTDDLTKLYVRRYFEKRLEEELVRARRFKSPLSLLIIDIDRFKQYNDTFGHSAGDKMLRYVGILLKQAQHAGEVVARLGGEEFAWLLPNTAADAAVQKAEDFRRQMESAHLALRRAMTGATVSIGIAVFPKDGENVQALLKAADQQLYRAKVGGRNKVCFAE
ncbi:MAG: sensor domain-containing diguanylate cyclase [Candidatus Omnitrophica bacterium]|nr:sensor domain-containing diguanylate cyclase [Candidatus Omnitrophota bacterium]